MVTSANVVTYEAVPNAALANSAVTLNAGTSTGYTAPGAMSLGSTTTFGATTDVVRMAGILTYGGRGSGVGDRVGALLH